MAEVSLGSDNLALGAIAEFSGVSNIDIDTGTETVDSFADVEGKAVFWDYVVVNGTNPEMAILRAGRVMAAWDASTDAIIYSESSTSDIGDTSGVSFAVDINANNVRLRCTVTSDNWAVYAIRALIG